MFIAALFTVVRTWKQPKCPTIDDGIKKLWNIYTMDYYSAIRRDEILPFAVTFHCINIPQLLSQSSSIVGHFGCFHVLTNVNNAAINIGVQISFWIWVFKSLG